jgi:hypothetical protein
MNTKLLLFLSLIVPSLCFGVPYEFIITEMNGYSSAFQALTKSLFKNGKPDEGSDKLNSVTRILMKEDLSVIISHNNGIHETQAKEFGESSIMIREDYLKDGISCSYFIHPEIKNPQNPRQILVTYTQTKDAIITKTAHYWGWADVRKP